MKIRAIVAATATVLSLAACGGGDDASGQQGEVADLYITAINDLADELGVELDVDEGCVRDLASQLSDEDAAALMEAGLDGDPEVSAEGDEIGDQLESCISEG